MTIRGPQEDLRPVLKNGSGKMRNVQRKPWAEQPIPRRKRSEDPETGKDLGGKTVPFDHSQALRGQD